MSVPWAIAVCIRLYLSTSTWWYNHACLHTCCGTALRVIPWTVLVIPLPCYMSALWPHLFTPMPSHNTTTRQHWPMLLESWSVPAPTPHHICPHACLSPITAIRQGGNACSHVYSFPEPLHGGRHVCVCSCCVPVCCITCSKACGVRAPHIDGIDTCLHLCLVPVLPGSGVDTLVDMFMSQGYHMAVQACQFLHSPCPGKASGQHEKSVCACCMHTCCVPV